MGECGIGIFIEQLACHHEMTGDEIRRRLVQSDQFPTYIGRQFFGLHVSRQSRALGPGIAVSGRLCRTRPARPGSPGRAIPPTLVVVPPRT